MAMTSGSSGCRQEVGGPFLSVLSSEAMLPRSIVMGTPQAYGSTPPMSASRVSSQLLHGKAVSQRTIPTTTPTLLKNKNMMCFSPQSSSVHPAGACSEARHGAITPGVHGRRPHAVVVVSDTALVVLQAVQALAVTHLQR